MWLCKMAKETRQPTEVELAEQEVVAVVGVAEDVYSYRGLLSHLVKNGNGLGRETYLAGIELARSDRKIARERDGSLDTFHLVRE